MSRYPLLCASVLLMAAMPAAAAIKCWTNAEGVRECGNAVPPEYSQQRTRTLNERGITIEVQERAKTAEEIAAEESRTKAEAQRRAEAEQRQREQAAYDRVLMSTFTSEEELLASRERKLAAIEATIEVTELSIGNLHESMGNYKRRAADLERAGRPVPDDLTRDIANLQQQVDDKRAFIGTKQQEMGAIKEKYGRDLQRFRELIRVSR